MDEYMNRCEDAVNYYYRARKAVQVSYSDEIEWQRELIHQPFEESDLLREAAWVIFCSGFRESVVRKKFTYLSLCFFGWTNAADIVANSDECVGLAMHGFRNEKKLTAVVDIAIRIEQVGFLNLRNEILANPLEVFCSFPYIGSITSAHLAKNLGFPVAKNDRHMLRLCTRYGFADGNELCGIISAITGDPIPVVDLVLWRFMAEGELDNWSDVGAENSHCDHNALCEIS